MKIKKINLKEKYGEIFTKRNDREILDFIFENNFFPENLYIPLNASVTQGWLSLLFNFTMRASILKERGELSNEKFMELFWGKDLLLKNQDEIFQEKGELIMIDCRPCFHSQADDILLKLYPGMKPHYLAFDVVKIEGRVFYLLLQVGFLTPGKIKIKDNLPKLNNIILKEEKVILYPLFEEIFKRNFFKPYYFYLN